MPGQTPSAWWPATSDTLGRTMIAGYKVPRALILGLAPRTNVGKPDYATACRIASDRLIT